MVVMVASDGDGEMQMVVLMLIRNLGFGTFEDPQLTSATFTEHYCR